MWCSMVSLPSSRREGLPGEVLLTGPEVVGQHPSGTQVASKWHPSVRAHAEEDAEAAHEFGMVVACIEVAAIPGLAVEVEG